MSPSMPALSPSTGTLHSGRARAAASSWPIPPTWGQQAHGSTSGRCAAAAAAPPPAVLVVGPQAASIFEVNHQAGVQQFECDKHVSA
jgi:hypothetical protein